MWSVGPGSCLYSEHIHCLINGQQPRQPALETKYLQSQPTRLLAYLVEFLNFEIETTSICTKFIEGAF